MGMACAFLVGQCSCEIKALNPGTDLLMPVDWEGEIDGHELSREIVLPPLPGAVAAATSEPAEPVTPKTPLVSAAQEEFPSGGLLGRNIAAVAIAIVLAVFIATAFVLRKGRSDG